MRRFSMMICPLCARGRKIALKNLVKEKMSFFGSAEKV